MCTKVRLAASMSGMCMQEFPKTLHSAQQLLRLQSAPDSLAMLAVHLQDRDHQQRGSDSRRVPRLIFRHSPKDLKRSVDGCVRPVHRSVYRSHTDPWKSGQSLVKGSVHVAKLLPSWQYQLTPAAMEYTATSCWQHPCVAPARQKSPASTCSALPTERVCPPCGIAHLRLLPLHARLCVQICPTERFVRSRASASESSIPSEVKLCTLDPST